MPSRAAKRLEISLLGELSLRREGLALGLPASRKTRALLGYLVATGRPQSRARLCELLWEGPVDPRAELRWSLSKLRALFDDADGGRFEAEGDTVEFRAAGAVVDLETFRELADREPARAATLVRGEFLAGLDLPDCFRFNAWLLGERERLFLSRTDLHRRLAELEPDGPEAALGWARSWVALDPLSEEAHAAVVRALLALGRPREANAQVETCRRILRQELGEPPGERLETARRQRPLGAAKGGGAPRTDFAAGAAVATPADPVELVGREEELSRLEAALAGSPDRPPFLLVTGEAGIGKSRLLQEVGRRLEARGGRVVAARGFEAESSRPYAVWLDLARAAGSGDDDMARLPTADAPAGVVDRERFERALGALFVRHVPRDGPLLLVLDDLQWIDEASLALAHAILERDAIRGVVLAGGLRPGEAGPASPAAKLVRDFERESRLARIDLGPLGREESVRLVRSHAPHVAAEPLARASEGHPLFAVELARAARATAAGESTARDGAALSGLPPTLQALVGERLARLDGDERTLAAFAAVLGTGFEVETLARLSGLGVGALDATLEALERRAILRAGKTGYDFAHDIVRRVAYEQIAAPRRRFLHAEAAKALAAMPDPEGERAETVARQAALGGLDRLAAEACLAAAERGLRLTAVESAADAGERGLAHLPHREAERDDGTLALRFALLRALVHATQGLPRREGIRAEVERWVEVARRVGKSAELQLGLYLLAALSYAVGDLSAAERQVLDQAEALRDAEPRVAAAALANAGRCLAQIERDQARAEALLREARAVCVAAGIELLDVSWGLGMVAHSAGRFGEAREELSRALVLARAGRDPWIESQCLARLAAMAIEQEEYDAALARSGELAALAGRSGEWSDRAIADALAALARFRRGADGAGGNELDAALDALRAADSKMHLAFVLNRAAERDLAEGRRELAAARAAEALEVATRIGRKLQIAHAHLLRARLAESGGDAAAALLELDAAVALDRPAGALGARIRSEIEERRERLGASTPIPTPPRETVRGTKGARA